MANPELLLQKVQQLEAVDEQIASFSRTREMLRGEINTLVLLEKKRSKKKTMKFHNSGKMYVLVPHDLDCRGDGLIDLHVSQAPNVYESLGASIPQVGAVLNPSPGSRCSQKEDWADF